MSPATLLSTPTWTVPLADGDFTQRVDPVGGSLAASALIATIPLLVVFVFLGILKTKAYVAALSGLLASIIIAVLFFAMPTSLALLSATQGFVFGVFPIMWIVVCAIWLYQLTVTSGRFEDLRAVFDSISEDPRIQAVLIAFCFGGLLEALAGFGAPVAITATMIIALGMTPLRTAAVVLLANTAPVAFGAIAIPITTAAALTGIPATHIGAIVGRQAPLLAVFVPILLLLIADGRRGVREVWPAALVTGLSFAIAQFVTSNYISVELTDIVASLVGLAATVVFLRFWQPKGSAEARLRLLGETEDLESFGGGASSTGRVAARAGGSGSAPTATAYEHARLDGGRVWMALFPYLLIIVIFSRVQADPRGEQLPRWHRRQDLLARPERAHPGHRRQAGLDDDLQLPVAVQPGDPAADLRHHRRDRLQDLGQAGGEGLRRHRRQAADRDPHRGLGPGPGLRDEPVRPDHRAGHVGRRYGRVLRLPVARSSAGSAPR